MTQVPLRSFCIEIDERLGRRPAPELLSVSQNKGVVPRSSITDKEPRADDLSKYKVCQAGDIVLNRFNAYRGSLGRVDARGIVSPDYVVLRPLGSGHSGFLTYRLLSTDFSHAMKASMGGLGAADPDSSGFSRVDTRVLMRERLTWLSFEDQHEIASYLDAETAKSDALIGKQESMIETLAERRQAVISHAVSRGLNAAAPTMDSGNSWIGSIPTHWSKSPFVRLTTGRVDYRGATPIKTEGGIQLITARNIKKGFIDREASREYVSADDWEQVMRRGAPKVGDLLLTMEAPLGNVALVDDANIALAQRVVMFRLDRKKIVPEYANYLLNGFTFQEQILSKATGSTALGLKASKLIELQVAVPPLPEQAAIVNYLDRETSRIDALAAKTREMIDVLKERRQALISAAVTGEIDVRTTETH